MDNLTKEQRSRCMSNIKSKWTLQEIKVHNLLKGRKIKHKMHPKIEGSPDLILPNKKIAVFINGCFWHKCPLCYKNPKSRKEYWTLKINYNFLRDIKNKIVLRQNGWHVILFWEHQLKKNLKGCISKISND